MEPIRVVLADDHAVVRAGMRAELGSGFEVVGEADDAEAAIDVVKAHRPDLVVSDLHMPRGGGLAVVAACATISPIVILTVSEAEQDLLDAVAEGAAGYLLKTTPIDELRAALRNAAAGEPVFSPSLAALVIGEFRKSEFRSSARSQTGGPVDRPPFAFRVARPVLRLECSAPRTVCRSRSDRHLASEP